ncbi:hypothetical protein [Pelagovum pacificum]|uniref:Sulfotransferase family protein n=1 Tax=Pelagovum pacificum TaxID=2588711 RepID=A0A5C5G9I1_9RHOB|nr:hypothetical protein [Pelagovum pacificum]QQA41923.1 hypothetical protein I8N54_14110 [Pelagovum pacificum]TNY30638.1 hypothetical protein FHY64_18830 [Pelagovum pacificum]
MDWLPQIDRLAALRRRFSDRPAVRYQVLGERCSGTNFLDRLIAENLPVAPAHAVRWKHGFPDFIAAPADVVFVVIFREALGWISSLYSKPWHADPQLRRHGFSEFIRAKWRSSVDDHRHFRLWRGDSRVGQPLNADLHPLTGQPFNSVFELRAAKMAAHLSLPHRGARVVFTTLAEATADPAGVIKAVAAACNIAPPGEVKVPEGHFGWTWEERRVTPERKTDIITPEERAYILSRLDLAQERRAGLHYPVLSSVS